MFPFHEGDICAACHTMRRHDHRVNWGEGALRLWRSLESLRPGGIAVAMRESKADGIPRGQGNSRTMRGNDLCNPAACPAKTGAIHPVAAWCIAIVPGFFFVAGGGAVIMHHHDRTIGIIANRCGRSNPGQRCRQKCQHRQTGQDFLKHGHKNHHAPILPLTAPRRQGG